VIGPLALLAAMVAGILAGDALGPADAAPVLVLGVLGLVTAFVIRDRRRVALVVAVVAVVALGIAVEQRALHGLVRSPLSRAARAGLTAELTVTLTDDPSGPMYATEALAVVDGLHRRDGGGRTVLLRASGDEQSALRVVQAGDRLRLRGRIGPLTGFSTRQRWRHAVAAVDVERVTAVAGPADPAFLVADAARGAVLRGADTLPSTPRALLAGFVLGDTRAIPSDLVDDFRAAGLSHLLAVSGANVAFALAIAEPFLRRRRLATRFAGGVAVLVVFGTMTRWEPSVLRASVMAGLVMLARLLGRPADAGRVLALAMLGLLATDPFLLHSVGFLLSCGACAGIAFGAEPIGRRLRGPRWFREALGVTAAAQVGVAPVLLAVFGTLPLVALPANLVAAPFVGPLTIWGLVASTVGGVLGPGVGRWLQLPTLAMLRAVESIARTAARFPVALDPPAAAACAAVLLLGAGAVSAQRAWSDPTGRLARRGRRVSREGWRSDPAGS
jgi:competence protein ComEC